MKTIHGLCCLLLPVTVALTQRPDRGAHALIGTWRLVEFADLDKDGKWKYRFVEHRRGYIVYDATGHEPGRAATPLLGSCQFRLPRSRANLLRYPRHHRPIQCLA